MAVPISNVTRRVVYAASGTGPYAFTFEILANTDIAVYKDDTLLTLTTDYTVTIAANGTGSITLVAAPTGATQIAIVGNRTIQRTTDFVTGGDFFANTVNDEMDQQTIFAQQNAEGLQRALSAPQTDPTSINMTLPRAALRANKALGFDANGNPAIADTLGTNRGNWSASTLYYVRDIVKDTTNSNIWQCLVQHTSSGAQPISTNADVAKWSLLVDAAAAATSATNAAASASAAATSASNASTSASNASSSASTASTQASNASTSASNAASSASAASSSASTASTAATNAGNSATAAATSATNASNSASAASTSASNASSSASAASTSASNASTSATNAANSATAASGSASTASTQATNAASSATAAAASESAAASSASSAAASYDSFDDRYLGAKSSNPSVDNDGNALLTGAIYFNSVANTMRVYNGSAWQDQAASPDTIAERSFAATAGQTSYTFTGGYRVGYTYVYVNGALLDTADITATDGTTITFTSALSLNDEVRILSYKAIGSVAIGDISGLQTALDGKVAGAAATTTVGGDLKLYEGTNNGTNYTGFKAPASLAANVTYTLPSADGTADQVLKTNGSAVLSWTTPSGGGGSAATPTALGTVYGSMTTSGGSPYLTALGYNAASANTSGTFNTAVAREALALNTTGSHNTAVGHTSLYPNTSGSYNTSVGSDALRQNTTASNNTAVGYQSLYGNVTGANNTAVGYQAAYGNSTGGPITALGYRAGRTYNVADSYGSVFIGNDAGYSVTTGIDNVAVGGSALSSLTTTLACTAVGARALQVNTAGRNTAVGAYALKSNTTGSNNNAFGNNALGGNTGGTDNVAFGSEDNATGYAPLSGNTTGNYNVAIGNAALRSTGSGSYHTAVGWQALSSATDNSNVAVGYQAGRGVTSGHSNVLLGTNAAYATVITTGGALNVVIGSNAYTNTAGAYQEIVIGAGCNGLGNDRVAIGKLNSRIWAQYDSSGTWTYSSDVRLKKDIEDDSLGLSFINKLRPVKFRWKATNELEHDNPQYNEVNNKNTTTVIHGLIAQEVKAALDEEGVSTFGGWDVEPNGIQSISREMFLTPLINAIQELSAQIETLKAEVAALKGNV